MTTAAAAAFIFFVVGMIVGCVVGAAAALQSIRPQGRDIQGWDVISGLKKRKEDRE